MGTDVDLTMMVSTLQVIALPGPPTYDFTVSDQVD
jgi:hypothetical protein